MSISAVRLRKPLTDLVELPPVDRQTLQQGQLENDLPCVHQALADMRLRFSLRSDGCDQVLHLTKDQRIN